MADLLRKRTARPSAAAAAAAPCLPSAARLAPADLFKAGPDAAQYTAFDEKGFPTTSDRHTHWVVNCSPADHADRTKHKCTGCQKGFPTSNTHRDHYLRHCAPKDDPARIAYYEWNRTYENNRYTTDENYRVHKLTGNSLRKFMKDMGLGKHFRTDEMLRCTYAELIVWLNTNERGFVFGTPGTDYHIDHIRPLNSFKKGCRLELMEAWNFNNLQLLPGPENNAKRDTFTPEDSEAYYKSVGGMAILALRAVWRAEGVCECESCM